MAEVAPPPRLIQNETRYPNLRKYLELMKRVALIVLCGTWALLAVVVVLTIADSRSTMTDPPDTVAAISIGSLLLAVVAYFWYLVTLAGLEFIWVIIDIEENTRSLDINSRQKP